MDREQWTKGEWLCYMLGYMISKGWLIPQEDVESFKKAFPEIPEHLIEKSTAKAEGSK